MTINKVPAAKITRGSTPVITADDEALLFVNPNEVLIKDPSNLDKFLSGSLFGQGNYNPDNWKVVSDGDKDVPSLSDILNVTIVKYYDSVTKLPKARAIIKIRNSSKNAADVTGVDARIYDPSNYV